MYTLPKVADIYRVAKVANQHLPKWEKPKKDKYTEFAMMREAGPVRCSRGCVEFEYTYQDEIDLSKMNVLCESLKKEFPGEWGWYRKKVLYWDTHFILYFNYELQFKPVV